MFSTQYFQHDNDNDSIAIAAVFNKSPLGLILTFKKKAVAPTITGFETIGAAQGGHLQIGDEVVAANGVSLEGQLVLTNTTLSYIVLVQESVMKRCLLSFEVLSFLLPPSLYCYALIIPMTCCCLFSLTLLQMPSIRSD